MYAASPRAVAGFAEKIPANDDAAAPHSSAPTRSAFVAASEWRRMQSARYPLMCRWYVADIVVVYTSFTSAAVSGACSTRKR